MGHIIYLTRKANFCAAHRLHSNELSDDENKRIFGKCNHINGHGHNYVFEVTLKGEVDHITGMLFNLAELKDIIDQEILQKFDHKNLNEDIEIFKTRNPTAENIAIIFWEILEPKLPKNLLYEIKIYETDNNIAVYRG